MDTDEFRIKGKEMVNYIAKYLENIEKKRVTPMVEPGYLKDLIPLEAPEDPEEWDIIMKDIDEKIMIGMTHWQHPRFHAYFPSGNSYPSILADILGDAIGCIGFSWASGPACTELEGVVMDWFGKMMGLPEQFLACNEQGNGGGVIQTSASECVLVAMLAARAQAIKKLKRRNPQADEGILLSKLMAYCSKEAHSCVEKGAMIAFVKLRILEPDSKFSLRGETLNKAMEEDRKNGLVPFFVCLTIGTTSCCSFDNLEEIGPICSESQIWLHVDAAYAGSAMICPEFRHLFKGIEHADSLATNANKWLLTNFDCSCMWVKDSFVLTQALIVDPLYLQHSYSGKSIDYRHWGIPLSRRFRALKLWFVIRIYGVEGLREYIRRHCRLAKLFKKFIEDDGNFEIMNDVQLGLVCFRMKGSNQLNQKLLSTINASGRLHMVPASMNDKYVIRFCVCREQATEEDMKIAYNIIKEVADEVRHLYKEEDAMRMHDEAQPTNANEDDESREKVYELMKEKNKKSLQQKRSFFVRMVSDPKIYNPTIVKTRAPAIKASPSSVDDRGFAQNPRNVIPNINGKTGQSPVSSWISWPLAFVIQDIVGEVSTSEVGFRFRNWDSAVKIKPSSSNGSNTPNKTSPESECLLKPSGSNVIRKRSLTPTPPNQRQRSPSH